VVSLSPNISMLLFALGMTRLSWDAQGCVAAIQQ
jgi:hypothetical protein